MSYSVKDKYHRYLQDARTRLSIPMSKCEHYMFLFRNMCYQFFVWTEALPFSAHQVFLHLSFVFSVTQCITAELCTRRHISRFMDDGTECNLCGR
jgi:hypothetical protein